MKNITAGTLLGVIMSCSYSVTAQNQPVNVNNLGGQQNVLTTTVPFLTIAPDARSAGMGDVGVALEPDASTMHWNVAKLAFVPNNAAIGASYTPWLRKLVPDISLAYLSGYKRIDEFSGFGASLRYFSLGDITFTDDFGNQLRTYRPYEMALDVGYARKLSDNFSIGLAGRFIQSDLAGQLTLASGGTTRPGFTFAGDLGAYYTKELEMGEREGTLAIGGLISNLGGKITYTDAAERDFIPVNLRIGGRLGLEIDDHNSINFNLDFNKLLVPTPPTYVLDDQGRPIRDSLTGDYIINKGKSGDVPVITGVINSFGDAPGGFKEELREINPSIGIEYWYQKQVAGRVGYFYEHPTKGNRQYITVGLGIRYNILGIDVAYLIPTNTSKTTYRSPLEDTLRFSLLFNLGGKKDNK